VGRSVSLILLETGNRMMSDLPAFHCPWTDFNGTNPTCFCETCRNTGFPPCVLGAGFLEIRCGANDEIGFGLSEHRREIPALLIRPLDGSRHVLGVALRRSAV